MLPRNLTKRIQEALTDTPVVYLAGGRQTGKSTLAQRLLPDGVTLDQITVLAAATRDPEGFLAGLPGPTLIDEVQRAPQLFLALKTVVDRDRSPGRFLLTGSANPLLLPRVSESLSGRMEILTLWGLTQGELLGRTEHFLDWSFSRELAPAGFRADAGDLGQRLLAGGFPEVVLHRETPRRRYAWFESYVTSFIQRDVRDLANIAGALELPTILKLLATRVGQPLNLAALSRETTLQATTLRRYLALLEMAYFLQRLPSWSVNLGKRLTRAPKVLVPDTGLLCHLLGLDADRFRLDPVALGPILENFVANELIRQTGWNDCGARVYHFRAHSGEEVDLVLETPDGRVVGIEVKASHSLGFADWKGLRFLRDSLGDRFCRGVVLYRGEQVLPLSERIQALPVSALWLFP